ncbi:MAG: hypothetical protein PWR07_1374 [Bacillota bacterium]|nr:hypothetical protein [Bacillota bacterium]
MAQMQLSEIAKEISSFFKHPYEDVLARVTRESANPGIHVSEAWQRANPRTNEEIREFYESTDAYVYDLMVEGARDIRQQWREAILEALRSRQELRTVLDFGAGVANETLFLASNGYEVTYYDVAGITREFARYRMSHHPARERIRIALDKSELADSGGYDVILCLEVLEHLTDPLDTLDFLRRILRPDGLLILTQAFSLVGPRYPSHLPSNRKLASTFEDDCFELGLVVVKRIGPEERIAILQQIKPVDIIIPVYNGFEVLCECLNSIRANPDRIPHRLVLVNDGSDDPRVLRLLAEAQDKDGAVVIHHPSRLGFARSVNDAFSLSRCDVVILNSDTQVTHGWLTKLVRTAYRRNNIGTVTAASNNASIFSLPVVDPLPPGTDVNEIGMDVEASSPKVYPRIPVGVGFCMFIKREVLDCVGEFDSETFGSGYGEETEFCLRAEKSGYSHVLADDVYIHHRGAHSFSQIHSGTEIQQMRASADQRLFAMYPSYQQSIDDFKRRNPLGLNCELLRHLNLRKLQDKPRILVVANNPINAGFVGGIEFHVEDLIRHLGNDFAFYLLWCRRNAVVLDEYLRYVHTRFVFGLQQPFEPHMLFHHEVRNHVKKIMQAFSINLVHVHHIMLGTLDPLDIAHLYGIPVVVTVHDYYLLCPNYNLLDKSGTFCQLPSDERRCSVCLATREDLPAGFSLTRWRDWIREKLALADMLVFPSRATHDMFAQVYQADRFSIIPHGVESGRDNSDSQDFGSEAERVHDQKTAFSVCFLGYPAPQKGKHLMERAVPDLARAGVKVHFLGSRAEDWPPEWKAFKDNLVFHGPYSRKEVVSILKQLSPHLVLLPSPWPETFSYVLSEAMAAGVPAVVPPLGALAERVAETGAGVIMEEVSPEALVRAVLSVRNMPDRYLAILRQARSTRLKPVREMAEEYRNLYSSLINRRCHPSFTISVHSHQAGIREESNKNDKSRGVGPNSDQAAPRSMPRPIVSVLIDTRSGSAFLQKSIETLRRNTRIPFEVIVLDNDSLSNDEISKLVASDHNKVSVISAPPVAEFAPVVNRALEASQGAYVVIMHADVLVPSGWLEPMLVALQRSDVGIVGPRSNHAPSGQAVKAPVFLDDDPMAIEAFFKDAAREKAGQGAFVNCIGDLCIAVKRSLLSKIGGFDTSFASGAVTLSDFCLRAQVAGFRTWVAEDSFVYHYGQCNGSLKNRTVLPASLQLANDLQRLNSKRTVRAASCSQKRISEKYPLLNAYDLEWDYYPLSPTAVAHNADQPLSLVDSRKVHFLMCPNWDDPQDQWVEGLRAFTTAFDSFENVGLLIRIDPVVYTDADSIVNQINRKLTELGINLNKNWLFLIINDPLPPLRRGRLYLASHVFIDTCSPGGFSIAAEEAKACGLICCKPSPEALKSAYRQVVK